MHRTWDRIFGLVIGLIKRTTITRIPNRKRSVWEFTLFSDFQNVIDKTIIFHLKTIISIELSLKKIQLYTIIC